MKSDMKRTLWAIACLLMCCMTVTAQDAKEQQVSHIRNMYAWAKEEIAANGKNGNPAKDMRIEISDVVSEEHDITSDEEVYVYFMERRDMLENGTFNAYNQPYFIIGKLYVHGHYRYTEMLFEPSDGQLIFYYDRSETDAGGVFESRYYFDAGESLIKTVRSFEAGEDDDSKAGKLLVEQANTYLKIFRLLDGQIENLTDKDSLNAVVSAKAERIQLIRSRYAEAKQKIEQNSKGEWQRNITVTIHDQEEGVCPPITIDMNFYFQNDEACKNYCYFLSEHHYLMGFDSYSEYLIDPDTQQLMFSYQRSAEENQVQETRLYFDECGRCIETKSNADPENVSDGKMEKLKTCGYLEAFRLMVNPE